LILRGGGSLRQGGPALSSTQLAVALPLRVMTRTVACNNAHTYSVRLLVQGSMRDVPTAPNRQRRSTDVLPPFIQCACVSASVLIAHRRHRSLILPSSRAVGGFREGKRCFSQRVPCRPDPLHKSDTTNSMHDCVRQI
jgi:hypothetical protein